MLAIKTFFEYLDLARNFLDDSETIFRDYSYYPQRN